MLDSYSYVRPSSGGGDSEDGLGARLPLYGTDDSDTETEPQIPCAVVPQETRNRMYRTDQEGILHTPTTGTGE